MRNFSWKYWVAVSFVAALGVCDCAEATSVWTAQTGTVVLEEMPRKTFEQRRLYAFALIGAGQWRSGVRTLRRQIKATPQAEWVPDARLVIARALLGAGRYRDCFDEADRLAGTPLTVPARALQFDAARSLAPGNLGVATKLIDRLFLSAADDDQRAYALMVLADAALADERYLLALDRYELVPEKFPETRLAARCLLQAAECEWQMARWLDLGQEHLAGAEERILEFLAEYGTDNKPDAERARKLLAQVRVRRAERYKAVALFCWETENRPWAAMPWLEALGHQRFEGRPEGKWAAERVKLVRRRMKTPLPGTFRPLPLPAARTIKKGDSQ